MGAAEKRHVLTTLELKLSPETSQDQDREEQTENPLWNRTWQGLNHIWHLMFHATVVRKVGPGDSDLVVRNSEQELRMRY